MNALGYIRISQKDQSTYSLPYQERSIREYCDRHKLTLLEVFKDEGESSYTFDRPDFKALEKFIRTNKNVDYLIIFDHDRFSRNLAEALIKIKELSDKYGIKVLATTDDINTDFSDPSTFLLRAFKYMMAESELHRIRQRTTSGVKQAKKQGRYVNKAPYGYKNARDPDGKPIIIPNENADVVRAIFSHFGEGLSITEVYKVAKEKGFKNRGNSAIQRILECPTYAGLIYVDGQYVKGLHTPIISEDLFWICFNRISGQKHGEYSPNGEVPLRGALSCWCGLPLTAGRSKGKRKHYWYYLCKKHRENLPAIKLHAQFNDLLSSLSFSEDEISWFKEMLIKQVGEVLNNRGEAKNELEKKLKAVEGKIESAEEKYLLQPDLSQKTYGRIMSELRAERTRLSSALVEMQTTEKAYMERITAILSKLRDLRAAFEIMPLNKKKAFIREVFGGVLYYRDNAYRTPKPHEIVKLKEVILKEKGLLFIEQPFVKLGDTPVRSGIGSGIEHLTRLAEVLSA